MHDQVLKKSSFKRVTTSALSTEASSATSLQTKAERSRVKDLTKIAIAIAQHEKLASNLQANTIPEEDQQGKLANSHSLVPQVVESRNQDDLQQRSDSETAQHTGEPIFSGSATTLTFPKNIQNLKETKSGSSQENLQAFLAVDDLAEIGIAIVFIGGAIHVYWQRTKKDREEILKIAVDWTKDTSDSVTDQIVTRLKSINTWAKSLRDLVKG